MAYRNSLQLLVALCLGLLSRGVIGQTAEGVAPDGSPATETPAWTWMGGSSTLPMCTTTGVCGRPGVYGALGKFAAGNIPGGRSRPATWTDGDGNLWLFGGYGFDAADKIGYLNDLWEFNPSTHQWSWVSGLSAIPACTPGGYECGQPGSYGVRGKAAAGNLPGGRNAATTWTDASGHFWLFGGQGPDAKGSNGYLNDLWEFNTTTKEWTWQGGSDVVANPIVSNGQPGIYGKLRTPAAGNIPGGRSDASGWTDSSGNLWLFGGTGIDALGNNTQLNDLWEFNPATNEWAWMDGSSEIYVHFNPGVYGTLGVADAANMPGARQDASTWTDHSGNLWLFGGDGWDVNDVGSVMNDLWEFNPATNEWTWQGGSSAVANYYAIDPGVFGALGTFAAANNPSARDASMSWVDGGGNLWLFGGADFLLFESTTGYLNDAWEFNISTKEWAWMGGNVPTCDTCTQPGVYGTLKTANAANVPGGRGNAGSWTDSTGNLWIFGGQGDDGSGTPGYLNDLWEFKAVVPAPPATTKPTVTVSPSPGSVTTAQGLTVTIAVSGGSGKATPTGWVTLASGTYWSAQTQLSKGGASIQIGAGLLRAAVDTLTAYYVPDGASSSTYSGAEGSKTVDVANAAAATAGVVTVRPLAFGLWTTQTLPVRISVNGNSNLTATGTVTLKGGRFTSGATVLAGGVANIDIPGGSLPAGKNTLTASFVPDANTVETYTSAKGTAGVVVSAQPANGLDWTWMGGDSVVPEVNDQGGVYGVPGTTDPDNYPGGRMNFSYGTDGSGNFWLFGGEGNDALNRHALLNDLWKFNPSTKEWTWMSGSSIYVEDVEGSNNAPGVYGTLGKFAKGNVPGSRTGASSWMDSGGHLWLFGGYGFGSGTISGPLNDLWEFDPATSEWAWVAGSAGPQSQQDGVPGNYGTLGKAAAGNAPPARQNASAWIDNKGNLWLFGGYPQDSNMGGCIDSDLNDLWKFSPSAKEWTWEGGSVPTYSLECYDSTLGPPGGIYGTLGKAAAGNVPGSRDGATTWTDRSGNLWLFGGNIIFDSYSEATYNDLWEFNPTTNEWAWMSGSNTLTKYTHTFESESVGQAGVYGTLGTAAAGNAPGSRSGAYSWMDSNGNFWVMGGEGLDSNGVPANLNDLWEFNLSTKEWTWMGGTSTLPPVFAYDPPGIYGTLGEPASANVPGGREQGGSWTDKSGHLWLFGGFGWDAIGQDGWMNDLWEYEAAGSGTPGATTPTVTVKASAASITGAQALTVTATVSGGVGNPTPTGAVMVTTGSYMSTAVTLSKGAATIDIAAGALAAGTDKLTVDYSPDKESSASYTEATGTVSVTVKKLTPTISWAAPAAIPYGTALSAKQLDATASVAGTFAYLPGLGKVLAAGTQTLTVTFTPKDSEYGTATHTAALTVNRAGLVVTAGKASKVYGAALPKLAYTISGFVNSDKQGSATTGAASETTAATAKSNAGSYPITVAAGTLKAANYTFRFVNGTLTVTPAQLTVAATNVAVGYEQAIPKLTYTVAGFVNGDKPAVVTGAPVETTTATKGSKYGSYPITIATGTLKTTANYTLALKNGTVSIEPATAKPVFKPVAGTYAAGEKVTITDSTAGAAIYYTTNGSAPTAASTKYRGAIPLSASETIDAIAVAPGHVASAVVTAKYTVN